MENLFCEVIGCGEQAGWILLPLQEHLLEEPYLEEYLCEEHHRELARLHPDLACRYRCLKQKS